MRVTLLGHASLIVESDGTTVFVDPLLFGEGERSLELCPQRRIVHEALPRADAIVISHGHADHFDPESLARFDRATPVFMPATDPRLGRRLAAEGFIDVRGVVYGRRVPVGGMMLLGTPSRPDLPEMGVLLWDGTASVWDQVDTVVLPEACASVAATLPRPLDAAFCTYNPLLEYATMWLSEEDFPQARYERLLEVAVATRARTVVPGSFGWRMTGPYAWMNRRVYPVGRDRFAGDLRRHAPEQEVVVLDPGQALRLGGGVTAVESTPYAVTVDRDTSAVDFAPADHPPPRLEDPNPRRYAEAEMLALLAPILEERLAEVMSAALRTPGGTVLERLYCRRARVQIELVAPSTTWCWHVGCWHPNVELRRGADADADYTFTYVASQIAAIARGEPYRAPEVYARRRHGATPEGRLSALDPARLHGVDPYLSIDETFEWNPLALLEED